MSSQPYVYKPPQKRVTPNVTKSQITSEPTSVITETLKPTKISDLGSSSLFKGLDNMSAPPSQKRTQIQPKEVPKAQQKQSVKDSTIQEKNQERQPYSIKVNQTPKVQQNKYPLKSIQAIKKVQQQVTPQQVSPIKAPIVRKPYGRALIKQEQKTQQIIIKATTIITRQPLITNQPKIQAEKQSIQQAQSSSYSYKPTIRRTTNPVDSFISEIFTKTPSNSNIVQSQKSSQKNITNTVQPSKTIIENRRRSRESSVADLGLELNTNTKIFVIQTKNDSKVSSIQKIPTEKSIPSSSNIKSPAVKPKKSQIKDQTEVVQKNNLASEPKKYSYPGPKTKAELVKQNQMKESQKSQQSQKVSEFKIQEKANQQLSKSTLMTKKQTENKLEEPQKNNSTLIGEKQLKYPSYQYKRKSNEQTPKQQTVQQTQPHIIVRAQTSKNQPTQKTSAPNYTYQPAYKRVIKQISLNKSEEKIQNSPNLLIESRKTQLSSQSFKFSYQRRLVEQQKTITNFTIKSSPITSANASKQVTNQQELQQPSTKQKKQILSFTFSLLSILLRKKSNQNLRASFNQMRYLLQSKIKKQKSLQILAKKSIALADIYMEFLKLQTFNLLKRKLISNLTASPISNVRFGIKNKQSKEDQQLRNLKQAMRKPLCYQLNLLFNSRTQLFLRQKLINSFNSQSYSSKKTPLISSLHKLFQKNNKMLLQNSFQKLKSNLLLSKKQFLDIQPLLEVKNKKLSKQQIIKHFQNIINTQPSLNSIKRQSLLYKSPIKIIENKQPTIKSRNINMKPSTNSVQTNKDSELVTILKSKIQTLQNQLKQSQKSDQNQKDQLNSKKTELKKQIQEIKKENSLRKRQIQDLKQKLKTFEVISFSDKKQSQISYEFHQLVTPIKQSSKLLNQSQQRQTTTSKKDKFLQILSQLFVSNSFTMSQSEQFGSSWSFETVQDFLNSCKQKAPLIMQSFQFVMDKKEKSGILVMEDNDIDLSQKLSKTKELIENRLLVEQTLLLKAQIEQFEKIIREEKEQTQQTNEQSKAKEQVEVIKSLVKNYIQQRYLWEWIKRSLQTY